MAYGRNGTFCIYVTRIGIIRNRSSFLKFRLWSLPLKLEIETCMDVCAVAIGPVVVVPKGDNILNLSKGVKLRRRGKECVLRKDLKIDLGEVRKPFLLLVKFWGNTILDKQAKELRNKVLTTLRVGRKLKKVSERKEF